MDKAPKVCPTCKGKSWTAEDSSSSLCSMCGKWVDNEKIAKFGADYISFCQLNEVKLNAILKIARKRQKDDKIQLGEICMSAFDAYNGEVIEIK